MMYNFILQITQPGSGIIDSVKLAADTAAKISAPITSAANAAVQAEMSLWELLMKGGVVMIPILVLSLISIYVLIERYMVIRKANNMDKNFMNNIRDFVSNGNIDAAKSLCKNNSTPLAKMIGKGISRIGKPIKEIESSVESIGKLEVNKLEKNLNILGIIAGIAPMFGFIGTILGVIRIFYNISLADNISIGLISGGLYEKMITSAAGLVVGVFAFVGYHWLNMLIDSVTNKMETGAVEFIDLLQEPTK